MRSKPRASLTGLFKTPSMAFPCVAAWSDQTMADATSMPMHSFRATSGN
jgi:hypothetical protein